MYLSPECFTRVVVKVRTPGPVQSFRVCLLLTLTGDTGRVMSIHLFACLLTPLVKVFLELATLGLELKDITLLVLQQGLDARLADVTVEVLSATAIVLITTGRTSDLLAEVIAHVQLLLDRGTQRLNPLIHLTQATESGVRSATGDTIQDDDAAHDVVLKVVVGIEDRIDHIDTLHTPVLYIIFMECVCHFTESNSYIYITLGYPFPHVFDDNV